MGIFDRLLPKKDAPATTPDDPNASAASPAEGTEGSTGAPRQSPLDEATRAINETAKSLLDAAKPLGEAIKPISESAKVHGKSFMADVSTASRDLGGTLRGETPSASTAPTDVPPAEQTPAYETPSTHVAPPTPEATSATVTPQSPNVQSEAPPPTSPVSQVDDAQPLPDVFDPFADLPPVQTMTPDAATSESLAYEITTSSTPIVSPVPVVEAEPFTPSTATDIPATLDDDGNLEEYQEPLTVLTPSLLSEGTKVTLTSSSGAPLEVEILAALPPRGALNVYRAQGGEGAPLTLREAAQGSTGATRLERENRARRAIDSPQIPLPTAFGAQNERVYLADAGTDAEKTFASQLDSDTPLADQIFTLTQTSAALSQLHKAGFIHGALRPEAIILGRPVRLSGFESLSPIGQKSESTASFAGYGAPEIIEGEPLDARTDIYSVGALLHRVVTGQGVPETGWDDSTFAPQLLLPGAPQILAKTLGPPATRYSDMGALHRDLVRLRARLRPTVRHEAVGETTIGLEWGRTTNQDAWGELRGQKQGEDGAVEWTAWVVSDGMGGMASGEVASQAAVGAVLHEAANWGMNFKGAPVPEAEHATLVKSWAREANRQAVEEMNRIGARGGCTLVCGLVVGKRLTLAHVGDCRVYLWRDFLLSQLTRDHSYVMSLVMQGEITRDQMRDHPDRSKITRSLGDRHPMPDYFVDGLEVETKSPTLELQNGDILLAFSDGVWEPLVEAQMSEILSRAASIEETAHELVDAAMREGGPDNATVYIFKMGESAPVVVPFGAATPSSASASSTPLLPSDQPTL